MSYRKETPTTGPSAASDLPDVLCGGTRQGSVAKLTNQLSDGLPRQLSVSKQGAVKRIRPLLDAGLIVKHGTAKTGRYFLP